MTSGNLRGSCEHFDHHQQPRSIAYSFYFAYPPLAKLPRNGTCRLDKRATGFRQRCNESSNLCRSMDLKEGGRSKSMVLGPVMRCHGLSYRKKTLDVAGLIDWSNGLPNPLCAFRVLLGRANPGFQHYPAFSRTDVDRSEKTTLKMDPLPGVLWTSRRQPSSSQSERHIDSPKPVPRDRDLPSAGSWKNGSKMSRRRSAGIPIPVSLTSIRIGSEPSSLTTSSISIFPWFVYLTALSIKFIRTCFSLLASVTIGFTEPGIFSSISRFLLCRSPSNCLRMSCRTASTLAGARLTSIRPASTFDKSSTVLIRCSWSFALERIRCRKSISVDDRFRFRFSSNRFVKPIMA